MWDWSAPFDGSSPLTGYTVRLDNGAEVTLGAEARSLTFTGLALMGYTVSVAAVNAAGTATALVFGESSTQQLRRRAPGERL